MKGIVMDYRDGYAVVLWEDGVFEKIKRECTRGEQIELETATHTSKHPASFKIQNFTKQIAGIAAAAFIVSGLGYQNMAVEAYSYVTVDVNPSIEYTLNRMDKVIGVEALNEEAEDIVKEIEYHGKDLSTVLENTELALEEKGYLSDETDYILMNVVSKGEKHRGRLEQEMSRFQKEDKRKQDDFVMTHSSMQDRDMARKQKMSTGRYGEMKRYEEMHPEMPGGMPPKDMPLENLLRENGRLPEPREPKPFNMP